MNECERRAAGSWSAFMALIGVTPTLAHCLDPASSEDGVFDDSDEDVKLTLMFSWALLLAFLTLDTAEREARPLPRGCPKHAHAPIAMSCTMM